MCLEVIVNENDGFLPISQNSNFFFFGKIVILPEFLSCEMAFFHLYLANMSFSSETKCGHQ